MGRRLRVGTWLWMEGLLYAVPGSALILRGHPIAGLVILALEYTWFLWRVEGPVTRVRDYLLVALYWAVCSTVGMGLAWSLDQCWPEAVDHAVSFYEYLTG